jgi:S-formylglutathione hydrolase FrmB
MSAVKNLSLIDPPFLVGISLVTVTVFVASWLQVRRGWLRWTVRALGVALPILMAASAVNARYAYFPTVAAAFGRNAVDELSSSQLRQLELTSGPAAGALGRSAGSRLALAHTSETPQLQHGVVVPFNIPATRSRFHARTAQVYLPPAYFATPQPELPVIELLHGTPGSPADWTRAGFADITADAYAAQHDGYAPILVMPDVNGSWTSDSECVNGKRGQVQTYLTSDVRDAIIARFHTRADAGGWSIAGFSEGAYCALQMGLRHPDLYGAIGDFSGEEGPSVRGGPQRLFTGTVQQAQQQVAQYNPAVLLRQWDNPIRPPIWFEVGSNDITARAMASLDLLARADRFDTAFVIQQGTDHSFASWRDAFRDALPWFAHLTSTPTPSNTRSA